MLSRQSLHFLKSWQFQHATRKMALERRHKYANAPDYPMLDDIVIGTVVGASVAVPLGLSAFGWWCTRDSPRLENEAHAKRYFQKVLAHYAIPEKELGLRFTGAGPSYIIEGEDKFYVYINMKNNPRESSIQHEVLHYHLGDMEHDPDKKNIVGKLASWAKYFFYFEPRVIWKTRYERI
jgi:hypothetical protein